MSLFLKEERDQDFFRLCKQIAQSEEGENMSIADIARTASKRSAPSLYISQKECCQIIYEVKRGRKSYRKTATKQLLYREVESKYKELRERYPRYSIKKIAGIIVEQPASSFFISEGTAINLYYELIRKL